LELPLPTTPNHSKHWKDCTIRSRCQACPRAKWSAHRGLSLLSPSRWPLFVRMDSTFPSLQHQRDYLHMDHHHFSCPPLPMRKEKNQRVHKAHSVEILSNNHQLLPLPPSSFQFRLCLPWMTQQQQMELQPAQNNGNPQNRTHAIPPTTNSNSATPSRHPHSSSPRTNHSKLTWMKSTFRLPIFVVIHWASPSIPCA